jgi:hypothetical protein
MKYQEINYFIFQFVWDGDYILNLLPLVTQFLSLRDLMVLTSQQAGEDQLLLM